MSENFQIEAHRAVERAEGYLEHYHRGFRCLSRGIMDADDRAPCLAIGDWLNSQFDYTCMKYGIRQGECITQREKIIARLPEGSNVRILSTMFDTKQE